MYKPYHKPQRETGFTLVELSIVSAIVGIIVIFAIKAVSQQMAYSVARSQADQLKVLSAALSNYEVTYFTNLVSNTAVPGVANALAPSVGELQTLGLLDKSFSPVNLYSGGYATKLSVTPAGCTVNTCFVFGLSFLNSPIKDSTGQVDAASLGEAELEAGGDSGASTLLDSSNITGLQGSWVVPNPMGAQPGILAMRSGYGTQNLNQYLPRSGVLPMTGDLNAGGQNINNANTLSANTLNANAANLGSAAVSGTLNAGKLVTPNGANLQIGATSVYGDAANTVITQSGGVTVQTPSGTPGSLTAGNVSAGSVSAQGSVSVGGGVSATGDLTAGGNLTAQGNITAQGGLVSGWATEGSGCSTPGALARRAYDGVSLTCQNGIWTQLGVCSGMTDATTGPCPSGQVGVILYKRDYTCPTASSAGVWSSWYTVGNTCQTQAQAGWQ